jgi:flagellar hook protein FlgE
MASTTALFTGLGGLNVNARQLEVIGNNISNVNTTAYKSNRMLFSSAFNRTLSLGTGPTANSGGRNPGQVGLGVTMAGTQRNFNNGAIAPTGINTDLAIEGEGFFIVERNQEQFFTRAGSFQLNSNNDLVTISGDRVQGFEIDDEFNIIDGQLEDLNIPLGTLTIAEATSNVRFNGNLNADGEVATAGSLNRFAALTTGGGAAAAAGTLLTALDGPLFAVDDVITLSGGERGQKVAPDASFIVTATTTLADFGDFMMQAMGIVPSGGADAADPTFPGPEPGGFAVNGSGQMELTGNWGELNDIDLEASDFTVVDSAGVAKTNPFIPTKVSDATGESVRTTFIVYDSLGTELQIDMTMVLGYRDGNGTHWRSFLHSGDDTDLALHLETGDRGATVPPFASELTPMVSFDNFGQISSIPQVNIELDRTNTGALDPMQIALQFEQEADAVSALSDSGGNSVIAAVYQDGSPLGTLSSFSVGEDGIITGGFTNGLTQTIGQVAVAKFTNDEGLVDAGNNLFRMGPNSGTALVTEPLNFGTGRVIGGALEQANVDLSSEFTNMILTSTGYSASSRVINTTNELIQQLLVLGR